MLPFLLADRGSRRPPARTSLINVNGRWRLSIFPNGIAYKKPTGGVDRPASALVTGVAGADNGRPSAW